MRKTSLAMALAITTAWASAANAQGAGNPNALLRGTYAVTGSFDCLYSTNGFGPKFQPLPGALPGCTAATCTFAYSSVQGAWAFKGDGTGSAELTFMGIPTAVANTNLQASHTTFNFTYSFAPDSDSGQTAVNIQNDGDVTGTIDIGPAAGTPSAHFTSTPWVTTGMLSVNNSTLTQSTPRWNPSSTQVVETLTVATQPAPTVLKRICSRSLVLTKVGESTSLPASQ